MGSVLAVPVLGPPVTARYLLFYILIGSFVVQMQQPCACKTSGRHSSMEDAKTFPSGRRCRHWLWVIASFSCLLKRMRAVCIALVDVSFITQMIKNRSNNKNACLIGQYKTYVNGQGKHIKCVKFWGNFHPLKKISFITFGRVLKSGSAYDKVSCCLFLF